MVEGQEEHVIRSTEDEVKAFLTSEVWKDIQAELGAWLEDIQGSLEIEDDSIEVYRFQGRAQMLRHVLMLPANMLDVIVASKRRTVNGRD